MGLEDIFFKLCKSVLVSRLLLVTQPCLTLGDPVDCSTPSLPVPHHLPEFAQVHVHCISSAIQPSHLLMPTFPASRTFPVSRLFASGDQNIGVAASASVLPMSVLGWSPLRLVWSPCCTRDSRVFSSTTDWRHRFFSALPSLMVQLCSF